MYILNGFVCGGDPTESIRVKSVRPLSDRMMLITFNNGETRLFDSLVLNGPVYERLKDDAVFYCPSVDHGIVTWDNGAIDCSPEFMYQHSYEYDTGVA